MLHHDIWWLRTFCSIKVLRFFKSVLFKFAEKSDGERVNPCDLIYPTSNLPTKAGGSSDDNMASNKVTKHS